MAKVRVYHADLVHDGRHWNVRVPVPPDSFEVEIEVSGRASATGGTAPACGDVWS